MNENEFLENLLQTFKSEAKEHIDAITSGLIGLEKKAGDKDITETVFRESHSLKGAARSVNLTDIEALCQSLENVFAALKRGEVATSAELFDLLHKTVDKVTQLVSSPETVGEEKSELKELGESLERAATGILPSKGKEAKKKLKKVEERPAKPAKSSKPAKPAKPVKVTLADTVRISTDKLDSLLFQVEELLSVKLMSNQRVIDLKEINADLNSRERKWKKFQPSLKDLEREIKKATNGNGDAQKEKLNKLYDFLRSDETFFNLLNDKFKDVSKLVEQDNRNISAMVDNLLEDTKKVLMLPFSTLLAAFPKFVRDISREQEKEIDLNIRGGEIEIDRSILEEMKDPLIHLVRNCIDHGVEKPLEREMKNKSRAGKVDLSIAQKDGSKVEITVSDDGEGIDIEKIKEKAVEAGLLSKEDAKELSKDEALSLIFQSGISTSPIITDVSGRGLGLAIVQEKAEKVGGSVSAETYPGKGTRFGLVLPLTLATFRGILVRIEGRHAIIPTTSVERAFKIAASEIRTVENKETILFNGEPISLVRLNNILQYFGKPTGSKGLPEIAQLVVLKQANLHIAFLVDEILHEQEVLLKNLGKWLSRIKNIAGCTVLGSGMIVPIVNVADLIKSAVIVTVPVAPLAATAEEEKPEERKSILIVEDSITARTLLKNILDVAGYESETAVDGVDALAYLKTKHYDLVVSDVLMPRLDGFQLAEKIRADEKLAEMPVVLVTTLESAKDRERGIEAGANAYIIKSRFDQSDLLKVIESLI